MTIETLKAAGLTEEQAKEVMKQLEGGFVTKSRFDQVNAEKKAAQEQAKERDTQIEALKAAAGASDELKKQIADLQAANAEKDKRHAAEVKRLKRASLDESLLAEFKAINPKAVTPFLSAIDDGVDDEGYVALRRQHIEAEIQKLWRHNPAAARAGFLG